ncbi:MAG: thymidine phosphorylase, partial [Hoeflea sp.]|nr:thymidine phosphorylase [Hoeflea sp.]
AGLGELVLDVKSGNGAFMDSPDRARELARSLVEVAVGAGMPTTALVTDMNEPLASAAGNAVEVRNAADFLTGASRDARLEAVTLALAAEMLVSGGLARDAADGMARARRALEDGRAAEIFNRMVFELGGPADFLESPDRHLGAAPLQTACTADRAGYVTGYDTRGVGLCVVALGGGRTRPGDAVDHAVGLTGLLPVGTRVDRDTELALIHARDENQAASARAQLRKAVIIGEVAPDKSPVIMGRQD